MLVLIPFNVKALLHQTQPKLLLDVLASSIPLCIFLLQIISGVFLMAGVYQIRHFYEKQKVMDHLNTKTLLHHSMAFGLYLGTVVVGSISYTVYVLNSQSPRAEHQFFIVLIIWYLASAVA